MLGMSVDPFLLDECPHIFFIGNQAKFDSKLFQGQFLLDSHIC